MSLLRDVVAVLEANRIDHTLIGAAAMAVHGVSRRDTIKEPLAFEPLRETKNQKPLIQPKVLGTAWELRFGPDNRFRVFYRVDVSRREVHVLAIGLKKGGSLFIGGLEVKL